MVVVLIFLLFKNNYDNIFKTVLTNNESTYMQFLK